MTVATDHCARELKRHDPDRWLLAQFAPPSARPALIALYAFNLEVARIPETVREPTMGLIRLQWWREAVAELRQGRVRRHPVVAALAESGSLSRIPEEPIERLLGARERDLEPAPMADFAALSAYAADTAGALNELALAVLGLSAAHAGAGRKLGIGWALTGLLRAVPFHAARSRVYLPRAMLDQAGVTFEHVVAGKADAEIVPVVRDIAAAARAHLDAGRGARGGKDARTARPILLQAPLARLYLRRIEAVSYRVFEPSLQRPLATRALVVAASAMLGRY